MSNCQQQQYCLRWNNHQTNLQRVFARLLRNEIFTDVTLACEGRSLQAHKLVLSACSSYFEQLFTSHPDKSPLVILKDIKYTDIKAIIDFMYMGEINVSQEQLSSLIGTAIVLKVKGLADVNADNKDIAPAAVSSESSAAVSLAAPTAAQQIVDSSASAGADTAGLQASSDDKQQTPSVAAAAAAISAVWPADGDGNTATSAAAGADCVSPMTVWLDPTAAAVSDGQQTRLSAAAEAALFSSSSPAAAFLSVVEKTPRSFKDVLASVKTLDEYVARNGGRDGFWQSEPTLAILSAIRERIIDLKTGAEALGVSYSTIYNRYREHHGPLLAETSANSAVTASKLLVSSDLAGGSPAKQAALDSTNGSAIQESETVNGAADANAGAGVSYPVVKLHEYLQRGGLRHVFWELESTRSVFTAVYNKQLDMKHGAELLGVSYGTLYGRYRENYGYLKSPGGAKQQKRSVSAVTGGGVSSGLGSMWEDPSTLTTLSRVTSGQLTLQQAADQLGVDFYVLKYQLALMESAAAAVVSGGLTDTAASVNLPDSKRPRLHAANGDEVDVDQKPSLSLLHRHGGVLSDVSHESSSHLPSSVTASLSDASQHFSSSDMDAAAPVQTSNSC